MMRFGLIFVMLILGFHLRATHNRSGEITYRHISGNTYEFTITTCTKLTSEANRTELEIDFGDGVLDTIPQVSFEDDPSTDTKKNTYRGTHTYSGPGSYIISVSDPNRNANIVNIDFSVDQVFCIQTQLIISPFLGSPNNSIILEDCPCPEEACANVPWKYNLGAYDPDGDSLAYELVPCKGENCEDMAIPSVFQYPHQVGGGAFAIQSQTGTIIWDSPTVTGEYNFAIKVKEYRNGALIGYVIRDMQLTVVGNCQNNPPTVYLFPDTCVKSNSSIARNVTADDSPAEPGDVPVLSWEVFGEGFNLSNNPATFNILSNNTNPIEGTFMWSPGCSSVRKQDYLFSFKAEDEGPYVRLKDVQTLKIKVNGEAIENVQASAALNVATITWDKANCPNVSGYRVYRNLDSIYSSSSCCFDGELDNAGYELVGEVNDINTLTFKDEGPFVIGNRYCYTVTALYPGETESCLALPSCFELPFDVPVLTHVTINSTDASAGQDSVRWTHPLDLDTVLFGGPYQYRLYQNEYKNPQINLVYETAPSNSLTALDTFYVDTGLNTIDESYSYNIELWNDGELVGSGAEATSIYIDADPNDNRVNMTWSAPVPWSNFEYIIYRADDTIIKNYVILDTTDKEFYVDSGLINGLPYCYKILGRGTYSLPRLPDTLENWSQEVCAVPVDKTPPCPPKNFNAVGSCDDLSVQFTWTNPNNYCADDVTGYSLWFTPHPDSTFEFLKNIQGDTDTSYLHYFENSIAGCYYVKAYDSIQYGNISDSSNVVCLDNCDPIYNLPNVFTPNSDSINGLYHPRLPYKFISRIDIQILNRWGDIVYSTDDPMINWDGTDQASGLPLTEGVYFLTGKAYALKLLGEEPFDISTFIHLVRNP